jgi:hemerythrin-like metal-binding protein
MDALLEWHDGFRLGVEEIDRDHEEMFQLANEFYSAWQRPDGVTDVLWTLRRIGAAAESHFRREEALMHGSAYHGLVEHRDKHAHLSRQLGEVIDRAMLGETLQGWEVACFLAEWLTAHIFDDDRRLALHLTGRASP